MRHPVCYEKKISKFSLLFVDEESLESLEMLTDFKIIFRLKDIRKTCP